ncbi:MAG: PDZ domain-containing protein [Opitutales bacterium]|nr:PDZ domain-containing protein [Opitutales bacterium]
MFTRALLGEMRRCLDAHGCFRFPEDMGTLSEATRAILAGNGLRAQQDPILEVCGRIVLADPATGANASGFQGAKDPPPRRIARLEVNSRPEGARIELDDGEFRGQTPAVFSHLEWGRHSYKAEIEGETLIGFIAVDQVEVTLELTFPVTQKKRQTLRREAEKAERLREEAARLIGKAYALGKEGSFAAAVNHARKANLLGAQREDLERWLVDQLQLQRSERARRRKRFLRLAFPVVLFVALIVLIQPIFSNVSAFFLERRLAEQERLVEQRREEERRLAEQERLVEQRREEERRLAEQERLVEQRREEERRLAEQERLAELRERLRESNEQLRIQAARLNLISGDYRGLLMLMERYPDEPDLVTLFQDWRISRWTGSLESHPGSVDSIQVCSQGKTAVSSGGDLRVWNLQDGTMLRRISGDFLSASISADGQTLVGLVREGSAGSANTRRFIRLWDMDSGRIIQSLEVNRRSFGMAVSSNCRYAVTFSDGEQKANTLWDLRYGNEVTQGSFLASHYSADFSPDDRFFSLGVWGGRVQIRSAENEAIFREISGHQSHPFSIAFSTNGKLLASGSRTDGIILHSVESGSILKSFGERPRSRFDRTDEPIAKFALNAGAIVFSRDDRWIVAGKSAAPPAYGNTAIAVWCIEKGLARQSREAGGRGWVSALAFTPDGGRLLVGNNRGEISVLHWECGTLGLSVREHVDTEMGRISQGIGRGLKVAATVNSGSADRAGIQVGDVLLQMNGKEISDEKVFAETVQRMIPGTRVDLQVFRDQEVENHILFVENLFW